MGINKRKIVNDPLYGLIRLHSDLLYDIIEHPYFQRLRRIKQLGLTDLVYPGAQHTRFQHVIGATYLMEQALNTLRSKGIEISEEEMEGCLLAILLHDIGHGPFSHVLEKSILEGVHHEELSFLYMCELNEYFGGKLSLAIDIFRDIYPRKFFHNLVSSQFDMDRLDYLNRDAYFTGVEEGIVGSDRLIAMLEVVDDQLAIQEKGIHSVENFLNSRRLMYWQVYYHKTTIAAEEMLINIVKRAKDLIRSRGSLAGSEALIKFLKHSHHLQDFQNDRETLVTFGQLDDYDLWGAIKSWSKEKDTILSLMCNMLLERKLYKIQIQPEKFGKNQIAEIDKIIASKYGIGPEEMKYFRVRGEISNFGYTIDGNRIKILKRSGELVDVEEASDLPNIKAISKIVKKHYICSISQKM